MPQSTATVECPASVLTLDNGLTLIHHYVPATPVAVVDVWVRAGAIAEPDPWSGMAHFLEHMIFKGTDCIGPGVFDRVIESRGGLTNAATSHDYAHYFITTAAQYLEDTLPYLAELLLNASIPADEFVREREVVLEEIHQAFDNPDWLGFHRLTESVYQQHPYGRPILGTETKLMQRSPEEMRCFHREHYHPENMSVVVVGGVSQLQAVELVNDAFQTSSVRPNYPKFDLEPEPPIVGIRRQELHLPRLEQARLLMAWIGPGASQLHNAHGLDLLSVLLAEGRSSRLVRELREERGLVHAISSSFSLQQDSSVFTIAAWLDAKHLETVEAIVRDRIAELQTTLISPTELSRCKRLLANDYAFSTEAPSQLAGLYGYYNTIATIHKAVTYPEQIQALQAATLQYLARQYLLPDHYAVTILKPD